MEESKSGDHKKVERKLIKDFETPTDIQQEETKEEREDSFVEVKKKRKKKKRVDDAGQPNIVPQLDLQQEIIAATTALEESKERVLTEEHRVKREQLDVKPLNIENQEEPQLKKKKKKRDKTPELQQFQEAQEEVVKTEEDPPKVIKKKRKRQPEHEPIKPELEQTSAFALTEINGITPINQQVESTRIPLETKFSNLISQKSYNLAHSTIESADTRSCITQDIVGGDEKIKVFVRVRPMIRSEIGKVDIVFTDKNNPCVVKISDSGRYLESNFNRVFDSKASQRDIFDQVQYCIDSTLYGYNSTIFAYGQTGSGKTFSIFGDGFQKNMMQQIIQREDLRQVNNSLNNINIDSEAFKVLKKSKLGIIPRAVAHLFKAIDKKQLKCTVYLSFLQIYNEQIFDMLGASNNNRTPLTKRGILDKGLKIREDGQQGTYVEGLVEYVVTDKDQCYELLIRGERIRAKRQTRLNMQSSRSHTIFQLLIESDQADEHGMLKRAKLNLGDLAGSEKIFLDEFPSAQHLSELKNINLSLTTLGKVISKLTVEKSSQHVPFRDSKLTRLLQDSLGGNTRTCLLATISPLMDHFDETMSTLKFAERTKQVRIRITKNEINAQDDQLVQKLQREIQHLRDLLQMRRKGDKQSLQQQVFRLRAENDRLREIALSIEEVEKLKQENKQMRIEMQKIMLEGMIEASEEIVDRSEDGGTRMSIDNNSGKRNSQSQPRINQGMINESQQLQVSKSNKSLHQNRRKRIIAEINDKSPIEDGNVHGIAQDTMKFVKRRIQDTGATEEEHDLQVSREMHQPLILLEESNFNFFDNNDEIRASRVVISDLLDKQKKLRQKMTEAQLNRQESKSATKPTRDSQLEIDQALHNSNTMEDPEEDEDFTTYYTPDLVGDKPYVSRQNLNHTRIVAGLTNKSENFEKNEESFSVQEQPYQDPKLVYNNIKQLLKKGNNIIGAKRRENKHASALIDSQTEMIPLKKNLPVQHSQEVIPYPTQSSITSQTYLPNVNSRNNRMHPSRSIQPYPSEETKGGYHHKADTVTTTTPTRTAIKSYGITNIRNQELSPIDPYNQQYQAKTSEKPTLEIKRTVRYRNKQESRPTIRSNMTNKQPTYNHMNSGGLSQNVLEAQQFMQNRRKSNELNSFRTRNNNLVSGSTNHMMTDMNNHRRSLPKLVDNQQSTTYTSTNNAKFINKKRVLAGGGGSSFILNQEDKKKNDQEVFYRRATERLVMLEQMEQDRKKKFELELLRLQKEQNFSLGFHNNQMGSISQVNPSRNTHLRRQGKTTGSSIYFNNRM